MTNFYDREGNEITEEEWTSAYPSRRIDETTIDGFRISTVWLGLSKGMREGEPLIFETMIFSDDEKLLSAPYCKQWVNEGEARRGHEEAISWAQEHLIQQGE